VAHTFAGLDAARRLCEAEGFRRVHESDVDRWHGGVGEERFERRLPRGAARERE